MLKAKIYVKLKASVLDPQGKAVTNSLHNLGFTDVLETRISKYIEMNFTSDDREKVSQEVEYICNSLLANPNTEVYQYEIVPLEQNLEN
ncbi:MAG TPA: phosphoribosylformylglycinamidine synthase subunit PurS [Candidatus Cloacimonas sp.]|jgi:phosphoribosylformylglycinamidine synthase|nr:phosphoribosylformylglycinamidine synthase subunit PurS [Candidatus Cloacimonas sp.]MDD2249873.1 phosphoribosylformylglycinamidine synthase subunit PurS [Candidatus Cloacimonadota bacterium]MCK9157899.1 phosphoribosylformylglycinamidine synthase subunit PurS [Candidatus Cloacimonas sp.]MCK9164496.1 phosphoribosylformylglycinamidine synthase subunit PurS [Candidatus Cloacimonas sp.]MDD4676284.1 phosphoribosylformylglycinamidine synthase subunit PurS [Candidatus Cloacimonadota bacterium]